MKLPPQIRQGWLTLLKYTLNPLTRTLARASFGPFSIIRHVGRRSGKHYETPIIVQPSDGGFVFALTYGPDVDWYKNNHRSRWRYAYLAWPGICARVPLNR